jgi:hypothetical protein
MCSDGIHPSNNVTQPYRILLVLKSDEVFAHHTYPVEISAEQNVGEGQHQHFREPRPCGTSTSPTKHGAPESRALICQDAPHYTVRLSDLPFRLTTLAPEPGTW